MFLPCRDRIELVQQSEQLFGLVPGIAGDRLRRRQRVGGDFAVRSRGRREEIVASIGIHPRGATREQVGQRREIGHCRRLAAVERVLNSDPPAARLKIDEVRHIAGGDAQAERVTLDRGAVQELRVGPHRRDGCHLVDDNIGRGRVAQHRQQRDGWIIAATFVDGGRPPLATRYRLTSAPSIHPC